VVLVAHAGLVCKLEATTAACIERGQDAEIHALLEGLPERTLDAVVAGHTHLAAQATIRGTPVIEAGAGGERVGVLHLFAGGRRPAYFEPFINVPERAVAPAVSRLLAPYRAQVEALRGQVAGEALGAFPRSVEAESALGDLLADALLRAGRQTDAATMAVVHAGHIRTGLSAGPIRQGDIFRMLPFDNHLVVVELTGAELRRFLSVALSGAHGVASVSGLHLSLEPLPGAPGAGGARYTLGDLRDEAGESIVDARLYRVATVDYLAGGGDDQLALFKGIDPARIHAHPDRISRDLFAELLHEVSPIAPERVLIRPRMTMPPAAP
jgi:5'-nucleotidase